MKRPVLTAGPSAAKSRCLLSRPWTEADIAQLAAIQESGASANRASVALKRTVVAVRSKARELGMPFPGRRKRKAVDK